MAFKFKKSLTGHAAPVLTRVIIDNSDVIQLGDAVKVYNAGNAEVATAARPIAGFVHAVVSSTGLQPTPDTGTTDTWTVASDNETVAQIACLIDMSTDSIYSGDVDGTINTTNSSAKQGASFDLTDENSIAETTALRNSAGQLYGWGTDPDDSGNLLVSIMESERLSNGVYA